ncbi:HipA domain-containing protein [Actinomyces sp.]|uniref:type II toxin-antitoxin system HipA family toxin n=1 Tax=Actinomyces sp. TaxID=29317 RepID=UPI00289B3FE7|nr:HipA domain-containing protein [Actinomyces sp.]
MRLAVELHGTRVGTIDGDARTFDFVPSPEAIERFGANSTILSVAIPLAPRQRRDHARRRRNWFAELLPEGSQYEHMLAQGHLIRGDTPAFLARYGRDVAGALQIWDLDDPTEPRSPGLRELSPPQVRRMLEDPVGSPLANEASTGKSSLGGVQPKIVLVRTPTGWAQAVGGQPTTHILKPQLGGTLGTVIFDEEFGSRLSRRMGLAAFGTTVADFDGLAALVVERYDRSDGTRVHQEDLSQALGAEHNEKYQEMGGVVSLRRVAEVLSQYASALDLHHLARMVVLSVAVGNLDMHTKNIALLHPSTGETLLAPAYDVVPQAHGPNDGRLALAVNGTYRHQEITRADLVAEFTSWGLRHAEQRTSDALDEIAAILDEETPLAGSFHGLLDEITSFVDNLRSGLPVGGAPR